MVGRFIVAQFRACNHLCRFGPCWYCHCFPYDDSRPLHLVKCILRNKNGNSRFAQFSSSAAFHTLRIVWHCFAVIITEQIILSQDRKLSCRWLIFMYPQCPTVVASELFCSIRWLFGFLRNLRVGKSKIRWVTIAELRTWFWLQCEQTKVLCRQKGLACVVMMFWHLSLNSG